MNTKPATRDEITEPFQQRVKPWLTACFGEMISGDREKRNHHFLEEALELVQASGCTAHEAHQLVDYVYARPLGEPSQEVGGVMTTLAALCIASGLDMHAAAETELARIWTMVEAIRAKKSAPKNFLPLPCDGEQEIAWPKTRDVGRMGDMTPARQSILRVGLDSDNDVFVNVWDRGSRADGSDFQTASVEFCNGGFGGGQSPRTRAALINLMTAMEADTQAAPHKGWPWPREGGPEPEAAQAKVNA